ncbi:DUF4177 domain-containing protein [Alphaproteobacteria bacterium KMM 3653]|uniref:DUF4177 domain-containing protein n=1 Tax=Harenicola maris TaxID=2841044 RepID=A0AAP2G6G7_9RHOB|nr:DUF4177 domain-containing protein [Harenicola maris]
MAKFEYKVVPAPQHGKKGKGVKGTSGKFANQLEITMNELGAEGWEYLRSDTLPCQERVGLTGKTTTFQNMLVFRRALDSAEKPEGQDAPLLIEQAEAPAKITAPAPKAEPAPPAPQPEAKAPPAAPAPQPTAQDAAAKAAAVLSAKRSGTETGTTPAPSGTNVAAE